MEAIRKQIHTALFNVSRLCEQFFRKYPQYYPPQTPYESYSPYQYGGMVPVANQFPPPAPNAWGFRYGVTPTSGLNGQNTHTHKENGIKPKDSKNEKVAKPQVPIAKKSMKAEKKQLKKKEILRQQREREMERIRQESLKKKKKERNTLKNQIKKDPRFSEKPKFPMSPYFLFLQQMRANPKITVQSSTTSNKQFAQQMGKAWRQMDDEKKKPYITSYLKEKRVYDEKTKQFYEKYPDLKRKNNPKEEKPMYSVDDPKYQDETVNDVTVNDEQELESDLLDELQSQEDSLSDHKQPVVSGVKRNQISEVNKIVEKKINIFAWNKRKDSLSDERLTSEVNTGNSPSHVVQID